MNLPVMNLTGPLILIGCGKMGGAMLTGWIERGLAPGSVYIVEPNTDMAQALTRDLGINAVGSAAELPEDINPGTIIFAVKPQMMDAVAPEYRKYVRPGTVFISIAAGKSIAYFENHLGTDAAIIRTMPNTPAAVSRGISVAISNAHVSEKQRQSCDDLLSAVGEVAWTDDEGHIDAVTGLSGGGPAYVFLLVEGLTQAGIEVGLPPELAAKLARVTVAGSGELLHLSPDEDPATLRKNVTSPGGTTAEALKVLMGLTATDDPNTIGPDNKNDSANGWQPLLNRAVAAATNRSKQLAG